MVKNVWRYNTPLRPAPSNRSVAHGVDPCAHSGSKDWNLTCLAISAGLINAIMGSGSSIYQYALYTFQWSSLDLGYFISASGLSTVIFLLVILPAIISVWKRVLSSNRHAEEARQGTLFDLHLVRLSSVVFATGYALMGVAPTGLIFTLCFVISTFGLGFFVPVYRARTTQGGCSVHWVLYTF
ncbi:hypothetical protein OG21DRAFT_831543 [Imleria badia]|nr:hypothetical protein OG21DRAFT_831543 [Imleria badia]